ncbi:MAG: HAD family acid phosphatase [Planctomycetota bacterium]
MFPPSPPRHTRAALCLLALAALAAAGRFSSPGPDQAHLSVAWTRYSAERVALCRQVFAQARAALDVALASPRSTAALEQMGMPDLHRLPPALITDVDETVLDNTLYNERLVAANQSYTPDSWSAWVREERAPAVPGVVAFLTHAAAQGVTVFYVTNRSHADEDATRANLARLGLPLQDRTDLDVVLTKGEQPDWTSDKRTRRAFVARTHRVALLLGDDLGDFLAGVRPRLSLRGGDPVALVQQHGAELQAERLARTNDLAALWGTRWFVLPNTMYGSWLETFEAASARDD